MVEEKTLVNEPCPFCGGEAAVDTLNTVKGTPGAYRVQCQGCGAATRWCATGAAAETAWSIRVAAPAEKAKRRYKSWQQLIYLLTSLT